MLKIRLFEIVTCDGLFSWPIALLLAPNPVNRVLNLIGQIVQHVYLPTYLSSYVRSLQLA